MNTQITLTHKWLTGDEQLRKYLGFGCPRIFKEWRKGTDKGNVLPYNRNGKSYLYRTDRVDEFIDNEFCVQHVKIKSKMK